MSSGLRGRGKSGAGGIHCRGRRGRSPPSLSLPLRGGGDAGGAVVGETRTHRPGVRRFDEGRGGVRGRASPLPSPPPSRGRDREGGLGFSTDRTGIAKREPDRVQYRIGLGENLVVPEPDHPISRVRQPCVTPKISRDAHIFPVLPSVDLDHQPRLGTAEVRDVGTDRRLTAERGSDEAMAAQRRPQSRLRPGHRPAQSPSIGSDEWRDGPTRQGTLLRAARQGAPHQTLRPPNRVGRSSGRKP